MSDSIDRSIVIKMLIENKPMIWQNDDYELGMLNQYENDLAIIKAVPSAEPETCAYWDRESNFCALHRPSAQPSYSCSHEKDAQPRMKGKWIPHSEKSREYIGTVLVSVKYDYWLCNICGYRVENGQPMYNFCPNCGAYMRGEKE